MKQKVVDMDKVLLDNEFFVFHKIDDSHFMGRPHFHDGFEIHFTLTNETTYYVDGRKFVMDSGAIAIFNSEEIHRVVVDNKKLYERYCILFKPRFIDVLKDNSLDILQVFTNRRKGYNCIQLSELSKEQLVKLFNELINYYQDSESKFQDLKIKVKFIEILIIISELFNNFLEDKKNINYEGNTQFYSLLDYIKNNYMEDSNLDDLANEFYISKSTIIRLFKKNIGMTPTQYLIYIRIMASRSYLEAGYSVKDVAYKIGYKDESSFIKKFKELQGISPKQYMLNLQRKGLKDEKYY
ncbi:AraC family transcriptional regulator [Clostridium saccharoperbutylacetonicum]